jgi:hypothetical protein
MGARRSHTQASTAVALSWVIFEGADYDVPIITVNLGTAPTTSENMTVAITGGATLATVDPIGKTTVTFKGFKGLRAGQTLTVAYTNTDTVAITGTATTELYDRPIKGDVDEVGEIEVYLDAVRQGGVTTVAGGTPYYTVKKEQTFANTTGTVNLFTVTGDVIVRIIAVTKTNLTSAGACNAELGVTGTVAAMIAATDVTTLDVGEIWHDATSDSNVEALSTMKEYILTTGIDVIMTLSAQIDAGAMTLYCLWTPLSDGASVVAA